MKDRAGSKSVITPRLLERLRIAEGKIVPYEELIEAVYGVFDPPPRLKAINSIAQIVFRQRALHGDDFIVAYHGFGLSMPVKHHDKCIQLDTRRFVPIEEFRALLRLTQGNPKEILNGKHPDQGVDRASLPGQNPGAKPHCGD